MSDQPAIWIHVNPSGQDPWEPTTRLLLERYRPQNSDYHRWLLRADDGTMVVLATFQVRLCLASFDRATSCTIAGCDRELAYAELRASRRIRR